MPSYVIPIYGVEEEFEAMSEQQQAALAAGHRALAAAAGSAIGCTCELDPVRLATTLRSDGAGGTLIQPGPFLDQDAALAGLYVLDASDDDAARGLAMNLDETTAGHSAVEVRRVAGSP